MAHGRRPAVLVVDDDDGIRDALSVVLESDYDVVTASDGRTALQIFRQRTVDAVLLDLRMPDIGGLEVLRQMHAIDPRVGVILVTAVTEIPTVVRGIQSGAVNYLAKPFATEDLLAAVAQAARRRVGVAEILIIAAKIGVPTALEVILDLTVAPAVCLAPPAVLGYLAGRRPRLVVVEAFQARPDVIELVGGLRVRFPGCPILTVTEPCDLHRIFERVMVTVASLADMPVAKPHVRPVVLAAAQHMIGHYREKLRRRDIARTVGVSTDQLGQAFEDSLGVGVKEFVIRLATSSSSASPS